MSFMKVVGKSLLARGVTFPITAISGLLTTSIVVASAGSAAYGAVSLISTLFLLLPYADLGLGAAVVNGVASTEHRGERKAYVISAFQFLLIPAMLVCLVGVSGASLFSWSNLLNVRGIEPVQADLATAAAIVLFGISVPLGVGQRALTGLGKNHVSVAITVTTSLVALFSTVIAGLSNLPVGAFAVAQPLGLLATGLISFIVAAATLRMRPFEFLKASSISFRTLSAVAGPMLVMMIALALSMQSHRLLISYLGTPADLSEYSLLMQFYVPVWSIIFSGATALWPYFARINHTAGNKAPIRRALVVFAIIGFLAALSLVAFSRPIGNLITDGAIQLSTYTLIAGGILIFVQALQQVPGMYFMDISGLRFQVWCTLMLFVLSLGLGLWLTPVLGSAAPLIATASGVVLAQLVPGFIRMRYHVDSPSSSMSDSEDDALNGRIG